MVAMPVFELRVQLFPPRLFGLPDGDWLLAPVGASAFVNFGLEAGSAVELEGQYRDDDQRLTAAVEISGMRIEIDDDQAHATLEANDLESALAFAAPRLQRFCSLVTTFIAAGGHPVTFQIADALADGQSMLLPRAFNVPGLFYNLEENEGHFLAAGALANDLPADDPLDQALNYFMAGEELHSMVTEKRAHHMRPMCFLQFWKALATVVGDPSQDQDHQKRFRTFGLGAGNAAYYAEVLRPLHDIRNQFDVAHIASLDAPQFVTEADVVRCRQIAAGAIRTYAAWKKRAGPDG